jgi:hypothetical protein
MFGDQASQSDDCCCAGSMLCAVQAATVLVGLALIGRLGLVVD